MKSKMGLITSACFLFSSLALGHDIYPPNVQTFQDQREVDGWLLRDPGKIEKKIQEGKIKIGDDLFAYHAWIINEDRPDQLQCIFVTRDGKTKVVYVMRVDNPKKYTFAAQEGKEMEAYELGLIKAPYMDKKKTDKIKGEKFDISRDEMKFKSIIKSPDYRFMPFPIYFKDKEIAIENK